MTRRPRQPARPDRDDVLLTSATDWREHRVPVAAYTAAMTEQTGQCRAVCGHLVVMVALSSPPGPPCSACSSSTPAPE